jgi:hypothetical protein
METQALPTSTHAPGTRRKKLLFGGVAVFLALSMIEVAARLIASDAPNHERYQQIQDIVVFLGTQESDMMLDFDPARFWKLKPSVQVDDPNNQLWQGVVSNSLGFRNAEFELTKKEGVARIVCFGDSSTFGIGNQMEDTWPSQLESLLQEHPDNPPVQVINAGVPGYTTHQGLEHMRQELDRLQPDVVIASYANHDFWHWDGKSDREQAIRFQQVSFSRLLRKSRAVQVLDDWLAPTNDPSKQDWAETTTQGYLHHDVDGVARVRLDQFEANLVEMSKICDSKNVRLIFMLWPDRPQVAGTASQSNQSIDISSSHGNAASSLSVRLDYQNVIKQVAEDRGDQVADVVSEFQRNRSWSLRTFLPRDIVHVNKSGNRLAAIAAEREVLTTK